MPGHRLPESNGKKCQDIDYPDNQFSPFFPCTAVAKNCLGREWAPKLARRRPGQFFCGFNFISLG